MTSASLMLTRPHVPPEDTPRSAFDADAAGYQSTREIDRCALDLSTAIARGDREAYERLYRAWFDRWLAFARAWTGRDESFCLDVVQDTAIRVAKTLRPTPTRAALEGRLLAVLRSCAIDRLRREQRALKRSLRAADKHGPGGSGAGPSAHALAELGERLDWLRGAVGALDHRDADLLAQRFAGNRTLRAMASATPESRHAVHGRVRRLVQRLRDRASELFHDP